MSAPTASQNRDIYLVILILHGSLREFVYPSPDTGPSHVQYPLISLVPHLQTFALLFILVKGCSHRSNDQERFSTSSGLNMNTEYLKLPRASRAPITLIYVSLNKYPQE